MEFTTYILIALCAIIIVLLIILLIKKPKADNASELIHQKLDINAKNSYEQMKYLSKQMQSLTEKNYEQQIRLIETLNENAEKQTRLTGEAISSMQKSNEEKLELMRKTVDEKLTETLNQRLNASFKTVSEQLSNVYRSLGEMKELSSGVTDNVKGLNRVLTNVKAEALGQRYNLGIYLTRPFRICMKPMFRQIRNTTEELNLQ